jgi:ferrous iron transport protein A
MRLIPLLHLPLNQQGMLEKITAWGELGRRLREMGLTPGTRITLCGRAPLADPVVVKVLHSTLTLRNNEAEHILVTVD